MEQTAETSTRAAKARDDADWVGIHEGLIIIDDSWVFVLVESPEGGGGEQGIERKEMEQIQPHDDANHHVFGALWNQCTQHCAA
jgi:hypothetical protein